jgi:hypothetical protein
LTVSRLLSWDVVEAIVRERTPVDLAQTLLAGLENLVTVWVNYRGSRLEAGVLNEDDSAKVLAALADGDQVAAVASRCQLDSENLRRGKLWIDIRA